jgi:hypothetical protein
MGDANIVKKKKKTNQLSDVMENEVDTVKN